MQSNSLLHTPDQDKISGILHFSLHHLLPDICTLAVNPQICVLSLLCDGPTIIKQQQLTENEMRVMMPILEASPQYCPYEVLLPSLFFGSATPSAVAHWQRHLKQVRILGRWQQELRPLRRTLSSLRGKVRIFDLEISTVREMGCSLTSLIPAASS